MRMKSVHVREGHRSLLCHDCNYGGRRRRTGVRNVEEEEEAGRCRQFKRGHFSTRLKACRLISQSNLIG